MSRGLRIAQQFGAHFQAAGVRQILAVQRLQAQARVAEAVQHQAAHLDLVLGAANDTHLETLLDLAGRQHFLMIQALGDIAQQNVGAQHHQAAHRCLQQQPNAAQHADSGGAPEGRGSIEPAHVQAVAHDNAAAEKTDTRHHIRGDPRRIGRGHARHCLGHQHEQTSAGADQRIGAQAGQALTQLSLSADQGTEQQGYADAQQKDFPIHSKPL